MKIVRVIDFETTGLKPPEAQVCEVGICDFHVNTQTVNAPSSWLCAVDSMQPEVRAVHHISLSECADHPSYDQAKIFLTPCDAIAAHNIKFESQFINTHVPMICTYKAALRVWPNAPSHSNGVLRYWLEDAGKIMPEHAITLPAHRAGPDAYTTAHILSALFAAGATGRDMVAWTKEPPVMPACPIGKFRGKPWPEVESGFLGWMLRQPNMDADIQFNARREIARRAGEHA